MNEILNPEVETALRNAFVDYGVDMSHYQFVPASLEMTEFVMPNDEDSPEHLKGKNLIHGSAIFDHVNGKLALGIEWSSLKDTVIVYVGQMTFLTKADENAEPEDAVHQVRR